MLVVAVTLGNPLRTKGRGPTRPLRAIARYPNMHYSGAFFYKVSHSQYFDHDFAKGLFVPGIQFVSHS